MKTGGVSGVQHHFFHVMALMDTLGNPGLTYCIENNLGTIVVRFSGHV